jgi:hypothetical protein
MADKDAAFRRSTVRVSAPRPRSETSKFSKRLILWIAVSALLAVAVVFVVSRVLAAYSDQNIVINGGPGGNQVVIPEPVCTTHGNHIIAMQRVPAGTPASDQFLAGIRGNPVCSNVDQLIYAAGYVKLDTLKVWYAQVEALKLMPSVQVNAFFTHPGFEDRVGWVKQIQTDYPYNQGYYIGVNSAPRSSLDVQDPVSGTVIHGSHATSVWTDSIEQGTGGHQPHLLGEFYPKPDAAQRDFESSGDTFTPVYLPLGADRGYGPDSQYFAVGERTFELNSVRSIGAVQAFTQGGKTPTADQVGGFALRLSTTEHPVHNIVLYAEGDQANDTDYIKQCADAVRKVLDSTS